MSLFLISHFLHSYHDSCHVFLVYVISVVAIFRTRFLFYFATWMDVSFLQCLRCFLWTFRYLCILTLKAIQNMIAYFQGISEGTVGIHSQMLEVYLEGFETVFGGVVRTL